MTSISVKRFINSYFSLKILRKGNHPMNRRTFVQVMAFSVTAFFSRLSPVMAIKRAILSPTSLKKARTIGSNLVRSQELSFVALDNLIADEIRFGNITAVSYQVFRESIRVTNEDKRYFLEKLKKYNELSEAMADYLKDLTGMGQGKGKPCDSQRAVKNTYQLEKSLNNVEYQIRRLPKRDRAKPDIKALVQSLRRDRKLITKARSVYSGIIRKGQVRR